jgi:hypothetical protein
LWDVPQLQSSNFRPDPPCKRLLRSATSAYVIQKCASPDNKKAESSAVRAFGQKVQREDEGTTTFQHRLNYNPTTRDDAMQLLSLQLSTRMPKCYHIFDLIAN